MDSPQDIKLIALDLDGTLLGADGRLPERNRQAVRAAAERGVAIALASGRMTSSITPTEQALGIDCHIVAYNGAMIRGRKTEGRRVLFHRPLGSEHARELIDFCRGRYTLNFYTEDRLYAQADAAFRPWSEFYSAQTGAVYNYVDDLSVFEGVEPTKLIMIADPSERDRLHDEWQALLGRETTIIKTNPEYLEFLHKDADKGVGLRELARSLGLAREQVMSMGDGDNDAPMLREAGLGIAVANAGLLARSSARIVSTLGHDDCAVADAIERHVLTHENGNRS